MDVMNQLQPTRKELGRSDGLYTGTTSSIRATQDCCLECFFSGLAILSDRRRSCQLVMVLLHVLTVISSWFGGKELSYGSKVRPRKALIALKSLSGRV